MTQTVSGLIDRIDLVTVTARTVLSDPINLTVLNVRIIPGAGERSLIRNYNHITQ